MFDASSLAEHVWIADRNQFQNQGSISALLKSLDPLLSQLSDLAHRNECFHLIIRFKSNASFRLSIK